MSYTAPRSRLGNTLDVTSTGAGGIDWGNIENAGTTVDLSATTTSTVDTATAVTTVNGLATDVITAASIAANAIGSSELATDAIGDAQIATGAIASTAFAAGAIDAAAIATDAIDADAIAANAIGPSELAINAIGSAQLSTAAAQDIRDQILSDSTPFAGANIDATISSRLASADINLTGGAVDTVTNVTTVNNLAAAAVTDVRSVNGTSYTIDTGGTTTLVDAALTEADDYWNGAVIIFTSGAAAGQIRVVTDFVASTDTITYSPASATTVATDTYEFVTGPNALGTADVVWDEVLTGATHNVTDSAGRRLRNVQEFGWYEGGAIFIDTVNGTAGTTDYESGTSLNPVDSIADANTLATSLGISRFMVAPGSSITLAATQSNQVFMGEEWTLALGGQNIAGTIFHGASVSGTGTGADAHFVNCEMGTATLAGCRMGWCRFSGTITFSAASDYYFHDCYSGVAGAGTPTIDFGSAVANTNLSMRRYSGRRHDQQQGQHRHRQHVAGGQRATGGRGQLRRRYLGAR